MFIIIFNIFVFFFLFIFIIFKYYNYDSISNKIRKKNNEVIDIFTYFQESLMLSIRLFRMDNFVDKFLIIVSNTTFSGKPLTISFSPFESFIEKFRKKILFYNISPPSSCTSTWCREKYQRNAAYNAIRLFDLNNDSIIISSDLDEIPTTSAMKYIVNNPPKSIYMLSGYMYYYNYRNKFRDQWPGIVVLVAKNVDDNIDRYRDERYSLMKKNSIPVFPSLTHCSYCYSNITEIQKKLSSFSHSEFNKPPYINSDYIAKCIKNHVSLFDRNKFEVVEYDKILLPLPDDNRFNFLKDELIVSL